MVTSICSAFTGALSYAHLVFVLADPPGWSCQDPGRAQCRENVTGDNNITWTGEKNPFKCNIYFCSVSLLGRESICEGGEVIFDTTHPSYFSSLLVDKLWICNDVGRCPASSRLIMIVICRNISDPPS